MESRKFVALPILFVLGAVVALVISVPLDVFQSAQPCPTDGSGCTLPQCLCSAQSTPGGQLEGPNIPQIVYFSFDDAVTVTNYPVYEEIFFDRLNPNGASVGLTFFVSHEYSNYSLVNELHRRGHEIALHSITHLPDTVYWANLNATMWEEEIVQQRTQLSRFSQLPEADIKGIRVPFLMMGGNTMYSAFQASGFEWDCTRGSSNQRFPGIWPYTNDYRSIQDCPVGVCPDAAFPGFWTVPMINLLGDDTSPCGMVDECTPVPMTQAQTYNLLKKNFDVQYEYTNGGNRAPFGVFTHAAWIVGPDDRPEFAQRKAGFIQFLDYLGTLNDVYLVTVSEALEWVRNPTAVSDIATFPPWLDAPPVDTTCPFPRNCRYSNETWERYMSSCIPCPAGYPWIQNHLGQNP